MNETKSTSLYSQNFNKFIVFKVILTQVDIRFLIKSFFLLLNYQALRSVAQQKIVFKCNKAIEDSSTKMHLKDYHDASGRTVLN